ncbi:2-methylisocitrate lyase-like PEP mutase family enzyme [Hoeflea halophila]|uniref:2-methylisocitrate lyase-like PEP mutase family enzyme n=1 Tax=Hoeflea halophila TaxID=714899 RepID=A0A286IBG4_9HYPH|nr:isocitrate lyase/phosphoenolpyruvate mutase family protein [Hoeflea halophila]SOE17412.1 2-methylisocitrate lyase-like PEP mutase family enzyme [Hoeflea halophila]
MTQSAKADEFATLHVPGQPLVLYNIWDAGSAAAIAEAGASAIATGSWSVAAAQGYSDGEQIPLELLLSISERIVHATDLPVTIDFEGGYARAPAQLAENVTRLIETGAVGINFEDQIVGADDLYAIAEQTDRIAAIRETAHSAGMPLFINARTDLFLKEKDALRHEGLVDSAIERAQSYEQAGASGFFIPGLSEPELIRRVCRAVSLPVNVLRPGTSPSRAELGALGVARISAGPAPYRSMIADLSVRFAKLS